MLLTLTLQAGVPVEFNDLGNFFRLMSAAAPVDVRFFKMGSIKADALGIQAGYAEKFGQEFDKVTLQSATTQQIQFAIRLGNSVAYDAPPQSQVTVMNSAGAVAQSSSTVTTTAAQLLAAKSTRRYLMIQNNDATGIVYINFSATATAANGIKIPPGGVYVAEAWCPTNAISAIGSIASNANVIILEG